MPFDEAAFEKVYDAELCYLQEARDLLGQIISRVISETDGRDLVRARIVDEVRIKSHASLAGKARERGWAAEAVFSEVPDAVGARVVCANLEDAPRLVERLRQALNAHADRIEEEDHDTDPSGYRAIHLTFRLRLPHGLLSVEHPVACEVQVRTSLQDAWARLSHHDLYNQEAAVPRDTLHWLASSPTFYRSETSSRNESVRRWPASAPRRPQGRLWRKSRRTG